MFKVKAQTPSEDAIDTIRQLWELVLVLTYICELQQNKFNKATIKLVRFWFLFFMKKFLLASMSWTHSDRQVLRAVRGRRFGLHSCRVEGHSTAIWSRGTQHSGVEAGVVDRSWLLSPLATGYHFYSVGLSKQWYLAILSSTLWFSTNICLVVIKVTINRRIRSWSCQRVFLWENCICSSVYRGK